MHTGEQPYGGGRVSAQRRLIAETVGRTKHVFTVESLAETLAVEGHDIGLATVYRAVAAMRESGFIERIGAEEGTDLYAHCAATDHHHHMVCTACGRVLEAPCPIGSEALAAARHGGFTVTGHSLTIYGVCSECDVAGDVASPAHDARAGA